MGIARNLTRRLSRAIAGALISDGTAGIIALSQPAGFAWVGAPNISRLGTTYSSDFNIDAMRPVTLADYYVDIAAADDTGAGTSVSPKKFVASAVTLLNAGGVPGRILVKPRPQMYHTTESWNGAVPTQSFVLEPWATDPTDVANRVYLIRPAAMDTGWFLQSGTTWRNGGFYSAPYAVYDRSILVGGFPQKLTLAADLADCIATAGSYWRDPATSRVYVHASDNRVMTGDRSIEIMTTGGGSNFRFACTSSITIWAQNCCFMDGSNCVYITSGGTGLTINAYLKDCTAVGGVLGHGMAFYPSHANSVINAYLKRCGSSGNVGDGFNYRSDVATAGSLCRWWEDACFTGRNGFDASGSNNSSSGHGSAYGVTINCDFLGSQDRVINDIDAVRRWMLGTDVFASAGSGATSISVQAGTTGTNTAQIWIDGGSIANSVTAALFATAGCFIRTRNLSTAGLVTGGAGTITTY